MIDGYVRVEATAMDDGAPAMYRYDSTTGDLRIAYDAERPAEAAAALTCLFARLADRGIVRVGAPHSVSVGR